MTSEESGSYRVPAEVHRVETTVANSRFIATIAPSRSVDEAKAFIARIRAEMPDASHHAYAFRIGHGKSVIEGMSDDREPSGTAGPPTLAVLRGHDVGDVVVVVTRYFGGTRLGTGGLVRAYSDAARLGLETLNTVEKTPRQLLALEVPYSYYEPTRRLIREHRGVIQDEAFAGEVTIRAVLPAAEAPTFSAALLDLTASRVTPVVLEEYP